VRRAGFLSSGLEALIRSIERFDPGKGATLEQYAWTRVHGAVLDEATTIERIDTLESADLDCDPVVSAERHEAKKRFRGAFARLSAQHREVAVLLYVEDATLREVGRRLVVSESRVSQIHTQLRSRLYEQLASETALFTSVG